MASIRNLAFVNDYFYHVFNRGLDKRPTFTTKRQFTRAKELLQYYQFSNLPLRFSQFKNLPQDKQNVVWEFITQQKREVEIIAYCLMPNHFHLLLKQKNDNGISSFLANFTNAYTKYYNTIHQRTGPLFQGVFKAVFIESEEQLLHVSRYIHLNPVVSSIISEDDLKGYQWSSYADYLSVRDENIVTSDIVISKFTNTSAYEQFVINQVNYAKELEKIKHLIIE